MDLRVGFVSMGQNDSFQIIANFIHEIMGHGESKFLSEEKELSKDYTIDSRIKEENLTYLTSRNSHQQFLLREIVFTAELEYQDMIRRLQQRRKTSSPFMTKLERLQFFKEQNLCSNYYRIYALWEYPRKTLAEEINYRALLKQPFEAAELKQLLLQIVEALAACEDNKRSHECLTTRSVLLTADNSVRVVDVLALPAHPNLEVVYHKRSTRNTYLSPAHCAVLASQHFDQNACHPFKEDVFIAGMIILQCALLERQEECYESNFEGVIWGKITEKLAVLEERYGRELRSLVEQMLEPDIQKRIDCKSIIRKLYPRTSVGPQSHPKVAVITQSVVREGRLSSGPPLQRVVPPSPVITQGPIITNPRNSFIFTYNSKQIERQSIHTPIQMVPIQRISFEHGPAIRVNEPSLHRFIPTLPQPTSSITIRQRPLTVIPASQHLRQVRFESSMSSKFTPIALTEVKGRVETVATSTNQNGVTSSGNKDTDKNKDFKIKSPKVQEVNEPLRPQVKNFSLHIPDPIFSIDEYAEGKRYEGYKVAGKKQGQGKFFLDNKLCFDGHWKDDLMEGQGKLYYQSGALAYDGSFHKDRFHGLGKLYNQSPEKLNEAYNYHNFEDIEEYWISYEGYFQNDLKEGHGELYLTNGEHFQGNFHIDFVDGEGIYTTKQGKQIHGLWRENKLEKILN